MGTDTTVVDPAARNLREPDQQDQTTCPVMPGATVDKKTAEASGLFLDDHGQRYWFCSKDQDRDSISIPKGTPA